MQHAPVDSAIFQPNLILVDEEHADGAGAAVAGDGAPGGGDEDFPEGLEAAHRGKRRL